MEKRLFTGVCVVFVLLAIGLSALILAVPNLHERLLGVYRNPLSNERVEVSLNSDRIEALVDANGEYHDMRLEFPSNIELADVEIEKDYLNKKLAFKFNGVDSSYIEDFPLIAKDEGIREIIYYNESRTGNIEVFFDNVLCSTIFMDGSLMYVDFNRPKDLYKYVVLLDAGHGGDDIGTASQGVNEKDLNLSVLKKLFSNFKNEDDIGVFYTRIDDDSVSLKQRSAMANDIDADLMVSVHHNSTSSGRISNISGTEVMYYSAGADGKSEQAAQLLQKKLTQELGSRDRGILAGDDLYIIKNTNCTTVLVEVGFMSNRNELKNLIDDNYQRKCAKVLYEGIKEILYENSNSNGE